MGEGSWDLTCLCTSESSQMTMKPAEDPDEELRFKQVLAVPVAQGSERRPGRREGLAPAPQRGSLSLSTCQKNHVTPALLATENVGVGGWDFPLHGAEPSAPGVRMQLSRQMTGPRSRSRSYRPGTPRPRTSAHSCRGGERPLVLRPSSALWTLVPRPPRTWPRAELLWGWCLLRVRGW